MIYPWQIETEKRLGRLFERVPHALLIHGPRGIGKLALAEHFAQAMLCEVPDRTQAPCGRCDGCRWYLAGSHPDMRRIEPEALLRRPEGAQADEGAAETPTRGAKPSTEIKIEQIRSLDGFLNLRSHRGRSRIALVHPAEDMNVNSANALLKSLEEPPAGAIFVLVSHRPARLPATVRSRCLALALGIPDTEAAGSWLSSQGVKEPRGWLAYASGAPLAALEMAQSSGQAVTQLRKALEARDLDALRSVNDRESLEALAEALQKYALDRSFAVYLGRGKYGVAGRTSGAGLAWLRFARRMGKYRALARHPLNPRLFAGEMLAEMPDD
jgi:DNA polymerase-3 subunit delta'